MCLSSAWTAQSYSGERVIDPFELARLVRLIHTESADSNANLSLKTLPWIHPEMLSPVKLT